MEIQDTLNELFVGLFHNINAIEEKAMRTDAYTDVTANDMHVIEAIGVNAVKNMSSVSKTLQVTMGTLTISVNSLVKKGYVIRVRSEEDRRVVLVSLSEKGVKAYYHHKEFHDRMIQSVIADLTEQEKEVLEKSLSKLNTFFMKIISRNLD